jgi:hypothetical protein
MISFMYELALLAGAAGGIDDAIRKKGVKVHLPAAQAELPADILSVRLNGFK